MDNVAERVLRKGHWYVTLKEPFMGHTTMPQYLYVWLKGNPSFQDVPKGYVVHHLDHDKLNDDISNLVIMQKHHHMAHHFKQKKIMPELKVDSHYFHPVKRIHYNPYKEPNIYQEKSGKKLIFVSFWENIGGERKRVKIKGQDGHRFKSMEEAQAFKDSIWPVKAA